jgi:hypothetical protein
MNLCKYKNIFGAPGTGIHSYRIFNLAIADIIATIILGYIISILTNYKLSKTLIVLFLLGIIVHRIFCVRTTIDKLLFP